MMSELETSTDLLAGIRGRADRLQGKRDELVAQQTDLTNRRNKIDAYLAIADSVTDALEQLSNDVFQRELSVIESTLTKALQEVLDQPVVFKATASFKRDAASVEFSIERNGNPEDIMRGQGGSVANVVSVGLRMFAVTTLDERRHRKFLVLDEQDCWLHPDLVPRLVKIVHEAGTALGFQVLMISHHDVSSFLRHADRVYRLAPDRGDGVGLELVRNDADVIVSDSTSV
ncbi:MAG: DNA repair protein [Fuerstiella sp.]|nr:DNA repair protein [Fuerstiella sp.]